MPMTHVCMCSLVGLLGLTSVRRVRVLRIPMLKNVGSMCQWRALRELRVERLVDGAIQTMLGSIMCLPVLRELSLKLGMPATARVALELPFRSSSLTHLRLGVASTASPDTFHFELPSLTTMTLSGRMNVGTVHVPELETLRADSAVAHAGIIARVFPTLRSLFLGDAYRSSCNWTLCKQLTSLHIRELDRTETAEAIGNVIHALEEIRTLTLPLYWHSAPLIMNIRCPRLSHLAIVHDLDPRETYLDPDDLGFTDAVVFAISTLFRRLPSMKTVSRVSHSMKPIGTRDRSTFMYITLPARVCVPT